jgi:MinD-like ATPase involved in chromosome partitioning or flagellar assembly
MLETIALDSKAEEVVTVRATAGKSIAVWGTPGSGKTSLALNLGMEFALLGHSVLLADLDTKAPSLSAFLANPAKQSTLTTALRMANQDRLDSNKLIEITEPLEVDGTNFRFLPGLRNPNRWIEVSEQRLSKILEATSLTFDFTIFDLASDLEGGLVRADADSARNIATEFLARHCTTTFMLFQADPIGVNRLIWSLQDFAGNPLVIANAYRSSVLGKNFRQQISDVLDRFGQVKVDFWIPWDQQAFDSGMLRGQPLWLASRTSKAREAIVKLARHLVESDD